MWLDNILFIYIYLYFIYFHAELDTFHVKCYAIQIKLGTLASWPKTFEIKENSSKLK